MVEMLDVYDAYYNHLGVADKKTVHKDGLYHQVFGCLFFNPLKKTVIMQTIYPKESYTIERPDYIDFTVGGHIAAGENVLTGGLREMQEELGFVCNLQELNFYGIRRIVKDLSLTYKIREFQHLYLLPCMKTLKEYLPNNGQAFDLEVKSLVELSIVDLLKLILGDINVMSAEEVLFQADLEDNEPQTITITRNRIIEDYISDSFFKNILWTLIA